MNPFEMLVVIVALGILGGVLKHWIDLKGAEQSSDGQDPDKETQSRIDHLEQRIQVLESIVTSDGYELKQKFRDLDQDH